MERTDVSAHDDKLPAYPQLVSAAQHEQSAAIPGAEIVAKGVADLARGVESVESLLVSIGAPRLAQLGIELPPPIASPELRLYALLAAEDADGAHSRYNALVRRLVSFERAAECAS
jgi:hypothetical protein